MPESILQDLIDDIEDSIEENSVPEDKVMKSVPSLETNWRGSPISEPHIVFGRVTERRVGNIGVSVEMPPLVSGEIRIETNNALAIWINMKWESSDDGYVLIRDMSKSGRGKIKTEGIIPIIVPLESDVSDGDHFAVRVMINGWTYQLGTNGFVWWLNTHESQFENIRIESQRVINGLPRFSDDDTIIPESQMGVFHKWIK